ncbi:ExbD/TolR family protein [Piscinibacter sp.]|uniref:ExbD/TolR family protein n=1 Tax=Piscinibacter sp. TaxID=1903157 RepID=UPI002C5D7BFC|nr:biopolymer transporter ExbD [Albitalea sp.]HUG25937.1 biopolymer transporter ExbD [Albitalea sp.]
MKVRRLRKHAAALEVTAFINLIVVLVPFLLSTAVFTRLSVIDLTLPAQSSGVEQLKAENLQLEVVIRPDALEVGDRIGGLIQRIPSTAAGPDLAALSTLMQQIKTRFPDATAATVLAQPDTPYDLLVQVMDGVRAVHTPEGAKMIVTELFTDISIGDAPSAKR